MPSNDDISSSPVISHDPSPKDFRELHTAIGKAMAEWARLEHALAHGFALISRTDPFVADPIFFSARAYAGKRDMLAAAIRFGAKRWKDNDLYLSHTSLFKAGLNKASAWEVVRNRMAHNQITCATIHGVYIGGVVTPYLDLSENFENTLPSAAIEESAEKFHQLSTLLLTGLFETSPEPITKLREKILQLPNPPYLSSVEILLRDAGVLLPREPSQG